MIAVWPMNSSIISNKGLKPYFYPMKEPKNILITGGAGFIGSHLCRHMVSSYPNYRVINLDLLTYAGNKDTIEDLESYSNYQFVCGDITDKDFVEQLFKEKEIDSVIHLAAESHVDRSITDPLAFVKTNVEGTANLLNAALKQQNFQRFYHISTDEVFGSLGAEGYFTEDSPYAPNSPYSASKASSDMLVRAYGETYGLPYVISNCSNNYGPNQFPEKLIPVCIEKALNTEAIPVYGDGKYTRDWLYVQDHIEAMDLIFHKAENTKTYLIGGHNEVQNIDLVNLICERLEEKLQKESGSLKKLISFVKDRPGHDKRYAIDASKLETELGWKPKYDFKQGLDCTIDWYLDNKKWLERIHSGAYQITNSKKQ